jgi:hypothetical protein
LTLGNYSVIMCNILNIKEHPMDSSTDINQVAPYDMDQLQRLEQAVKETEPAIGGLTAYLTVESWAAANDANEAAKQKLATYKNQAAAVANKIVLYKLATEIDAEWTSNGGVYWGDAEQLVRLCKALLLEDLLNMPDVVSLLVYAKDNDEWDSEFVSSWPNVIKDSLEKPHIKYKYSNNNETWDVFSYSPFTIEAHVGNVHSEDTAKLLINALSENTAKLLINAPSIANLMADARRVAADEALDKADFGRLYVCDTGGWTAAGDDWTQTVFFENDNGGDSIKGYLNVTFLHNSDTIKFISFNCPSP